MCKLVRAGLWSVTTIWLKLKKWKIGRSKNQAKSVLSSWCVKTPFLLSEIAKIVWPKTYFSSRPAFIYNVYINYTTKKLPVSNFFSLPFLKDLPPPREGLYKQHSYHQQHSHMSHQHHIYPLLFPIQNYQVRRSPML